MTSRSDELLYIFHHVFLPPKLPQKDDSDARKSEALLETLAGALRSYQDLIPDIEKPKWSPCINMVDDMLQMREPLQKLSAKVLEDKVRDMKDRDILAVHIRRMRRCFPGPAFAVTPDRIIDDASLLRPLISMLVKLDAKTPDCVMPKVTKARSKVTEIRDTVHPKLITEMISGILRSVGEPYKAPRVTKHTRDEVLWDSALKPWSRSPLWLVLRVALQTSLGCDNDGDDRHASYKSFMLFFMSQILKSAVRASSESESLFIMRAKIIRRALKLEHNLGGKLFEHVREQVELASMELLRRWKTATDAPSSLKVELQRLSTRISSAEDRILKLCKLRPYLNDIRVQAIPVSLGQTFNPACPCRVSQCSSELPQPGLLTGRDDRERVLHLGDLEHWVQDHLEDWLRKQKNDQDSCVAVAKLMECYISNAYPIFEDQPERFSLMMLTLMDLWVALDKCAVRQCHLLNKYDPEFPLSLFDPLLLPKESQMKRLLRIEKYLARRKAAAAPGSPSIFSSMDESDSFAVKYFDGSLPHQILLKRITTQAESDRAKKRRELTEKRALYRETVDAASRLECEYWCDRNGYYHHKPFCRKCSLESEANRISVDVHEWPLPGKDLAAKAVIFELDVPIVVSRWRNTTYRLLKDVCLGAANARKSQPRASNVYNADGYPGLHQFVVSQLTRLRLASTTKAFVVSHYKSRRIAELDSDDNILVNHGLTYAMYDSKNEQWTEDSGNRYDVREMCTLKLSPGAYSTLQWTMDGTSHESNKVISRQSECSGALTLHEFYSFGALRSGHRLQWRNIAREIVAGILNFGHPETHDLMMQAAWQAGPADDSHVYRESHVDLAENDFGKSLLSRLEDAIGTVEGSWQGATAASTFVALVSRLFSVSECEEVRRQCLLNLRRIRSISLRWIHELEKRLREAEGETGSKNLGLRLLEVALVCYATFDIDENDLHQLVDSDTDVANLTMCSIVLHDRCPAVTDKLPKFTQVLLRRHWQLSHLLEPHLRSRILRDPRGLEQTLRSVWKGYDPGRRWREYESPNERWLVSDSGKGSGESRTQVHYDVLSGSLLINGSPLTRLPRPYELHETYRRVFGERILDVVPSKDPDMLFETRTEVFNHQIYFGMRASKLIIRIKNGARLYEVLPAHALADDFPHSFVEDFVHWLDLTTYHVEWRPLKTQWTSAKSSWLMKSREDGSYALVDHPLTLIDVFSTTAMTVSSILRPLEAASHLHIMHNEATQALEVRLPRFKLDFFMRKGGAGLESKQFRGMVVDEDQSIPTFTGLANKLVLRREQDSSRIIIVPWGKVDFPREGDHVSVQIRSTAKHRLHVYRIDSQLGRLIDNGSLMSKLFKGYLHAVTSHCLADSLTGRTGTEEALSILESASVHSFSKLEQDEVDLLEHFARLTPERRYYPRHIKEMQQVTWTAELSPLSQHDAFDVKVKAIFKQARVSSKFQDEDKEFPKADVRGESELLNRASIRNSTYRVDGFGAEKHTMGVDKTYTWADRRSENSSDKSLESNVFHTAKLVDKWSTELDVCHQLLQVVKSWNSTINGHDTTGACHPLGYKRSWLDRPIENLSTNWCKLHATLSSCTFESDRYNIMLFLCTLSYSGRVSQELVETLLALATVPKLRTITPPDCTPIDLSKGCEPCRTLLTSTTNKFLQEEHNWPRRNAARNSYESHEAASIRWARERRADKESCVDEFVDCLMRQWPTAELYQPVGSKFSSYIMVAKATEEAMPLFQGWYRNLRFEEYILQVQAVLNRLTARKRDISPNRLEEPAYLPTVRRTHITYDNIFSVSAPDLKDVRPEDFQNWLRRRDDAPRDVKGLKSLLQDFKRSSSGGHSKRYADDLQKSIESLGDNVDPDLTESRHELKRKVDAVLQQCREAVESHHESICQCLGGTQSSPALSLAHSATMWPRLSRLSLLNRLTHGKVKFLSPGWKRCLVRYGLVISNLQRMQRIHDSLDRDLELLRELGSPGRQGWCPEQRPDWLLLEIENNLTIREVQAQIADEMISPSASQEANSTMQLNMGEGKSSVIVPIVAATLADGEKLVRIIVLKALAMEMFNMLLARLGGLLNRRVFLLPISRSVRFDLKKARRVRKICEKCRQARGILLVQPEHLLSFELMGIERLLSGDPEVGGLLVETRFWLDGCSRDILDESDEILSARFELIYTMGEQRPIELSPARWTLIQQVLGIVYRVAQEVHREDPKGLELRGDGSGALPRLRILESNAAVKLLHLVATKVSEGGLMGLPVGKFPQQARQLLDRFLTDPEMLEADAEPLSAHAIEVDTMQKGLLLVRGLIAAGTLRFALQQKRWRVEYGLDAPRTMLAVPYRAKDSPSSRAEYSHPDATIVLTCLSYYYGGLSDDQLYVAFERLLACDYSIEEYGRWVEDAPNLPAVHRQLTGINLSDATQCSEAVFPALRFAKAAIDFFTSQVVFPKEMVEFSHKLSCSGWDLARKKGHPTTGFSGTNDSRYILPLSISQNDLPDQLHTNATVLSYLLRAENRYQRVKSGSESEEGMLDANSLLQLVVSSEPPVRVILDVGAQVLEWKNVEVARRWLDLLPIAGAQAVIFFNDANELSVLGRDGNVEALMVSPFAEQTDQCLVYLDEAHTRGTDLKLPTNYRAAVTLGPRLVKDKLVQACMRMRKLGKGQSVMFCGPMEVERKMLELSGKTNADDLGVADVLKWSMSETCVNLKRCIPLWATQGVRHQRHRTYWSEASHSPEDARSLLETEAQSLEERYQPRSERADGYDNLMRQLIGDHSAIEESTELNAIRAKCKEFQVTTFASSALQEEQERELSPENEREQEVERPLMRDPWPQSIHPDVKDFVQRGILRRPLKAFQSAFDLFKRTDAAKHFERDGWSDGLLTTCDFAQTVCVTESGSLDSYLRPVHWIASSRIANSDRFHHVVLSPHEANALLPIIRRKSHPRVTLHVYSPRVVKTCSSLEDLAFCAIPALSAPLPHPRALISQLNLFAGQLYIQTYSDYLEICAMLGIYSVPPPDGIHINCDGFVAPHHRPRYDAAMAERCRFTRSPVAFLKQVMALRRKGQEFGLSHIGRILDGGMLTKDDF
ncbi:MAG: hypothetical protein M1825_001667 [Sarcosagium campestre]|nr:MAG: hypothetical protein M1825_001667 [Sarcosagium campestre]